MAEGLTVPVLIEARDGDLNRLGPLTWTKLDATVRYNAVGSWSLTMPATERNWELTRTSDVGVIVDWNGVYTLSGHAETWSYERAISDGKLAETITLSGADDLCLVANRVAYPNPAAAFASQTTTAYDTRSGPLETVIKGYVTANVGPAALAVRRHPALTIAPDQARGAAVTYKARFAPLMDLIRTLVATAGPMGVAVTQSGGGLVFEVYQPADLTQTAWFSPDLGNLPQASLTDTAPTATNALVAGSGQGTSRAFTEITGPGHDNRWQHVEVFVDQRQTSDNAELTQAGQDAIAQGAAKAQMSITAVDLPRLSFGVDYGLGDTITVEIREGVTYPDIVTAVQLAADADSETVTPVIGAAEQDAADDPTATAALAARVRDLERQLKHLQTGQ